jgi:hypothetical protein
MTQKAPSYGIYMHAWRGNNTITGAMYTHIIIIIYNAHARYRLLYVVTYDNKLCSYMHV